MVVAFYVAHLLTKVFISYRSSVSGIDQELYKGTNLERHTLNIISVLALGVMTVGYYLCEYMINQYTPTDSLYQIQLYAIISGAFILLYNGYRGYNKKWFQYGSYLYYPLHIAIIGLISFLQSL